MWRPRQNFSTGLILLVFLPLKLAYGNTLELSPALYKFNFQEFDQNNSLLNKEEGILAGFRVSYSDITERDTFKFNASFFGGSIDNEGETLIGIPNRTETDEQLIKLGISYTQNRVIHYPGLFFAGLHYWFWDRDILTSNGVQGLNEQFTWYETELGLKYISDSNYWLEISALYIFKPEMKLLLPSSDMVFSLQTRPGYRFRTGKSWVNIDNMTTTISFFAEYWEFGRSDPQFTTDFYGSSTLLTQPESESFNSGLEFSFIFKF
jgi:hypothetical protein